MTVPLSSPPRQELEEFWRLRVEEAHSLYLKMREAYRTLHGAQLDGDSVDDKCGVEPARHAAVEAETEYVHVLGVFTELITSGKMPDEQSGAGSDRV